MVVRKRRGLQIVPKGKFISYSATVSRIDGREATQFFFISLRHHVAFLGHRDGQNMPKNNSIDQAKNTAGERGKKMASVNDQTLIFFLRFFKLVFLGK